MRYTKLMSKIRSLPKSFGYAWQGILTALRREPNFSIHVAIGTTATILAAALKFSPGEWLLLVFTISFVLILELFNTAIEAIVNLVSPEIKPQAKIAKDVSAAAVLIAAFVSILTGFALFLPKILFLLN